MDKKDLLIIAHLRKNARQRITSMSKKIQMPVSTIFDRIKVQENNVIKKHTTLLDYSKLGFNARANIIVKVDRNQRDELQEFLMKNWNVNSLAKINNGYDFLAEVIFKNIKDAEDFLENIEDKFKIKSKQVYYIIDELKKEEFLADPMTVDLIEK